MLRPSSLSLFIALLLVSAQGVAESVVPLRGQNSQQTQADISECHSIANSASSTPPASGGRLRGAAVGATAGAVGAQVRGNQHEEVYDRIDDDVKQEYRQNRARETAATGAVVGGARQRQERRQQRHNAESTNASAYTSCLQGKGYQVTP